MSILGDDLVIADERVATAYMKIIKEILHVDVSIGKSIFSPTGCAEFAKRFLILSYRVVKL